MDVKIGTYHQCMALAVAPPQEQIAVCRCDGVGAYAWTDAREQIEHAVFERNGEIAIFPKSSEGGRDGK